MKLNNKTDFSLRVFKENTIIFIALSLMTCISVCSAGGSTIKVDYSDVGNSPTGFDFFGRALAYGDFNNDTYIDLAIGISGEDGPFEGVGAVLIVNGSELGLHHEPLLTGGRISPFFALNEHDGFGTTLASGDFNCDGIADLVIGVPFADIEVDGNIVENAGKVFIYNGGEGGLIIVNEMTVIDQSFSFNNSNGIEADDLFGFSLAVGNFNGDKFDGHDCDDLAVSAPNEYFQNNGKISPKVGAVTVFYGARDTNGLSETNQVDIVNQALTSLENTSYPFDGFGFSLAAGNFSASNEYDDLAIGIPQKDVVNSSGDRLIDAGAVNVLYGGEEGILSFDIASEYFSQLNLEGLTEEGDGFGSSLATGNINNSGGDELIVGATGERVGQFHNAGAVHIIYANSETLTTEDNQIFHPGNNGFIGVPSTEAHFGTTLTTGDINHDGIPDLVIGSPNYDVGSGILYAVNGVPSGQLDPTKTQGIDNRSQFGGQNGDRFSASLAVTDLGRGFNELFVGLPGETYEEIELSAGSIMSITFSALNQHDIIFANSFD